MARVAIHIVTYNSEKTVDACLQSLLRQRFRDFAVYVVDNQSSDGTRDKLTWWGERGINVAFNPINTYYSRAHNWLISQTQSEFVMTLNPDVMLSPEFLEHVVAAFERSPSVGSVNGKLLLTDRSEFDPEIAGLPPRPDTRIDGAGLMMFRSRRPYLRGNRRRHDQSCLKPEPIFGADGASAVYRRAMLEDVAICGEYFDEDFVIYREDVDLAWRAQLLGWDSYYVPDAIGYHVRGFHLGHGRKYIARELKRHSVKNGWLSIIKNEISPWTLLQDAGFVVSYQAKVLAGLLLAEHSSLPALQDVLRLWPHIMLKRAEIQKRRRRTSAEMDIWFR